MSENLELCPKCRQGHLRNASGVTIKRETEPPFTQTGSITERICDQCGHRQVNDGLKEHGGPASNNKVTGTVTRIDREDKIE